MNIAADWRHLRVNTTSPKYHRGYVHGRMGRAYRCSFDLPEDRANYDAGFKAGRRATGAQK